jgi:hypothetical protein
VPPPGYRRAADGRLEVLEAEAKLVRRAFAMRLEGCPLVEIRAMLAEGGIVRTIPSVSNLLANRSYLGEMRFGDLVNEEAHKPIVTREVFDAVQALVIPRGPRPNSEALLARLQIVRCSSCGGTLAPGTDARDDWRLYRCSDKTCEARVVIGADVLERHLVEQVQEHFGDTTGSASTDHDVRGAELDLEATQQALDAAIRRVTALGVEDEPTALEAVTELRAARDAARDRFERLARTASGRLALSLARDWEQLSTREKRDVLAAAIVRVDVARGRGAERLTVELAER